MRFVDKVGNWFRLLFEPKKQFGHRSFEDPPDVLDEGIVYLIGDEGTPWSATFICPCGCKARISLSLVPKDRPSWRAAITRHGITLHPSVWRKRGCRSHFFIRGGRVLWAKEEL